MLKSSIGNHKSEMNISHKKQAEQEAIRLAAEKLGPCVDFSDRCGRLGLARPSEPGGVVVVPMLGFNVEVHQPGFRAVARETGQEMKPADHLLALHYLLCEVPVVPSGEWITFRDFPGGAFYWEPFLSRSINPLVGRIGRDPGLLRERAKRFGGMVSTAENGDCSIRIRAIGNVDVMLIYHAGDDEFPPAAEFLYDGCARRVFCAEDAAVLGSRICLGLL